MFNHSLYMSRCVQLAQNGFGNTYPNPLVGSVIVHDNSIIGEGWHQKAGEAHAEVCAINSVKQVELLEKSTLYVNLEPCSHFGKTPPCADLIIEKKIPRVVIGCVDPNHRVAGRGIEKLVSAGCEVVSGVLEEEAIKLNRRFFTFHQKKRPYIILKWAVSEDGFIAPQNQLSGQPFWITNKLSQQLVHLWRTQEQAILVGTHTVIKDNPKLDARLVSGNNPIRVVIDRDLKIDKNFHVYSGQVKTIFITEKNPPISDENLKYEPADFGKELVSQILEILYKHQIQSVIIEGGAETLQHFINANIWDEARVFTGAVIIQKGIRQPDFDFSPQEEKIIGSDTLRIYYKS